MAYQSSFRSRFHATPKIVRWMIKGLTFVALASSILSFVLGHWLGPWTPQSLLTLTAEGIRHLFLWQWLSFFLVLPGRFSFGSLLSLAFTLFLLWAAGTALVERVGSKSFVKLFILCTLAAGVCGWLALLGLPAGHSLRGATALCYGLLVAWTMHAPSQRVVVFLFAQVQMRWLTSFLIGFGLLGALGDELYAVAASYGGAIVAAYLYGLLGWNLAGPFRITRRFDESIAQIGVRWRRWRHGTTSHEVVDKDPTSKIRRANFRAWESGRQQ